MAVFYEIREKCDFIHDFKKKCFEQKQQTKFEKADMKGIYRARCHGAFSGHKYSVVD